MTQKPPSRNDRAAVAVDLSQFRRALSCFATGVAVVTTVDSSGAKVGMTINSFNSVSLDPPLVLWSVAEDSYSYDVFTRAEHFAVNVLSMHQKDLADRFAQSNNDKFDGLRHGEGLHGVPLLSDFAACFECRTEHIYSGGDHKIIVGRVLRVEDHDKDPLIFYRGHYLRSRNFL